ncbi:hypothetical protein CAPTEDRAFT_212996 [Capitella teleta]|uniref:CUB domain-containing protein n=1 Tax=Capitella teleta TaxID=283909 RepID=R7TMH3_CAPTE|nr:hypothetical protein CAPTEDRAFT_212996 [Capitella teleta]|eukprot:ELT94814.1 hypothetical protein CAPTEDRAFT_212996 [Capitella teleta]
MKTFLAFILALFSVFADIAMSDVHMCYLDEPDDNNTYYFGPYDPRSNHTFFGVKACPETSCEIAISFDNRERNIYYLLFDIESAIGKYYGVNRQDLLNLNNNVRFMSDSSSEEENCEQPSKKVRFHFAYHLTVNYNPMCYCLLKQAPLKLILSELKVNEVHTFVGQLIRENGLKTTSALILKRLYLEMEMAVSWEQRRIYLVAFVAHATGPRLEGARASA